MPELFMLSPSLVVAICEMTMNTYRMHWGVYFGCSKYLIIINALKYSVTAPF